MPKRNGPRALFYTFRSWDGGKNLVSTDPATDEEVVKLRLRKKRYMKDARFLESIAPLETFEEHRNLQRTGILPRGKFITESVPLSDLAERLAEIIEGEWRP